MVVTGALSRAHQATPNKVFQALGEPEAVGPVLEVKAANRDSWEVSVAMVSSSCYGAMTPRIFLPPSQDRRLESRSHRLDSNESETL
jgi:hypothetical protein